LCDTEIDIDLELCDLRNADFHGQSIETLDLSDTDLRRADFSGADLYSTFLFRANCEGANFRNSRLSGVVPDGANLRRADFTGAYVSYDNILHPSSLSEADLIDALLEGVDLRDSQCNRRTIFPSGFDPIANGMVLVSEEQGLIVPRNHDSSEED
jgi:uncharacterized protein YjbI with pentapeptide repeats